MGVPSHGVTYLQFSDHTDLIEAARTLNDRGVKIYDAYTPIPLEELDDILHWHENKLAVISFLAMLVGGGLIYLFQYWTSAIDWPINVGGKPMNPSWAVIPVTYEICILSASLTGVLYFLIKEKLIPGRLPRHNFIDTGDGAFILAISDDDKEAVKAVGPNATVVEAR